MTLYVCVCYRRVRRLHDSLSPGEPHQPGRLRSCLRGGGPGPGHRHQPSGQSARPIGPLFLSPVTAGKESKSEAGVVLTDPGYGGSRDRERGWGQSY